MYYLRIEERVCARNPRSITHAISNVACLRIIYGLGAMLIRVRWWVASNEKDEGDSASRPLHRHTSAHCSYYLWRLSPSHQQLYCGIRLSPACSCHCVPLGILGSHGSFHPVCPLSGLFLYRAAVCLLHGGPS